MKSFISLTQLVRAQLEPYQRATWFLVECMEREQIITLRAMAPMWMRSPAIFAISVAAPSRGLPWVFTAIRPKRRIRV